jgi:hypothetical protein
MLEGREGFTGTAVFESRKGTHDALAEPADAIEASLLVNFRNLSGHV